MTFYKDGHLSKNKQNDWFSHETELVFVHGEVFKEGSRNSASFKMELFATICNSRKLQMTSSDELKSNEQYSTLPSLQAKSKSDENGHTLKVPSNTLSCFLDMPLHFFKKANSFLLDKHSVSILF